MHKTVVKKECLYFMSIPILTYVLTKLSDEILLIFSAGILGAFSDAALNLKWDVSVKQIILLVLCVVASIIVIPFLNLLNDCLMLKYALKHDKTVFTHFLGKQIESAMRDYGKTIFELEDAPNTMRISLVIICGNLLIIPASIAYLLYESLRTNLLLTAIMLLLSCTKLIVPLLLKKRIALYDQKNKEYQGERYSIEIDTMSNAAFVRSYGIADKMILHIKTLYTQYRNRYENRYLWLQSLLEHIGTYFDFITKLILLVVGAVLISDGKITAGQIVSMTLYLSAAQKILEYGSEIVQQLPLLQNATERVCSFYNDAETMDGVRKTTFSKITFDHISMRFEEQQILSDVSFSVNQGEIVCLTGENGSGKTTLMRILNTELQSYTGDVFLDDTPIRSLESKSYRNLLAYAPQQAYLFRGTVQENIVLANPEASAEEVAKLMNLLGISELCAQNVNSESELSGGELQKISIARALLKNTPILILDEPTNHLDSVTTKWLMDYLHSCKKTVFLISHDKRVQDGIRTIPIGAATVPHSAI